MSLATIQGIGNEISEIVGMTFDVSENKVNEKGTIAIDFRPEAPKYPYGFVFRAIIYEKRFEFHFIADSYALPLIRDMEKSAKNPEVFVRIANSLTQQSIRLGMRVNNHEVAVDDPLNWGVNWRNLEVWLEKYSADFNPRNLESLDASIIQCGSKFFLMLISLMPTEEMINYRSSDVEGLPEGAKVRVEVNKYERSPHNRAACIAVHGTKCQICNFDFGIQYGVIGMGFINVHHIIPVSQIGPNYTINPVKDLIPVCPNCHSMLHKETPPIHPEKLKEIVLKRKS